MHYTGVVLSVVLRIQSDLRLTCSRANTMMEILGLDKLAEDKIKAQQRPKSTFVPFKNMVSQRHPIPPTPRPTPIKHLYEAEMQACREKGLCYNCDGKFTWGHQCTEQTPSWMWFLCLHLKFVKRLRIQ